MKKYIIAASFLLSLYACETQFTPDGSEYVEEVVVEGYIEAGDEPTPPYVILTRSQPYFSSLSLDDFDELFIHNAEINVSNGDQTVSLTEICLNDLTPEQQELLAGFLGTSSDSLGLNFCVYTDLSFSMFGEENRSYDLSVEAEGTSITATTTIPVLPSIDSIYFEPIPNPDNDTLQEMLGTFSDPPGVKNFYRYFTGVNQEGLLPGLQSVTDDKIFDGEESFVFPIPKAQSRTEEIDPETYGYFLEGDTVTLKWCAIDEAHYQFWSTLEFNASNQGPFSSYTKITSNIEGGLGIWGGYSAKYYEKIVPFE
jgi:hypothetical protein